MIEVRIDSLAFGGDGVGRHHGQAVFVPLTAPGDLVRCRVVQKKRRYLKAELVELVEGGGDRCPPNCPVFGRCGGCQWQHLNYPAQAALKENLFADILHRQLKLEELPLQPILSAANPWHYRSRVQLKCHQGADGLAIGFFRRGSHFVEAVRDCPIAADSINRAVGWLYRHLPKMDRPDRIPQVDVSVGDLGHPRLVVHDSARQESLHELKIAAEQEGFSLFIQQDNKENLQHLCGHAAVELSVDEPPIRLACGPGGFSQVNLEQNRRMVKEVVDLARLEGHERVVDLYCGMGNLTLPLARRCESIVGVEDFAPAIDQARSNAKRNGIENARFVAGDAAKFLDQAESRCDLVVLDPPRSGAFELISGLLSLKPLRILYVSCDPMTLARDLKPLLGQGYRLVSGRAIDLFPQTYHLESICLLERV